MAKIIYRSINLAKIKQNIIEILATLNLTPIKNNFENIDTLFKKKNSFKGKIGIFEIENNKINHKLNFYQINEGLLKKIF